jgi:hypothetical protein
MLRYTGRQRSNRILAVALTALSGSEEWLREMSAGLRRSPLPSQLIRYR